MLSIAMTGPRLPEEVTPCILAVIPVFMGDMLVGLLSLTNTGIFRTSLNSTSSDGIDVLLFNDDKLGDRFPIFNFAGIEISEVLDSIPIGIIIDVAVADNEAEVADNEAELADTEVEVEKEAESVEDEDVAARIRNASVILSCRVIRSFDDPITSLPYNSSPLKSFLSFSFISESFSFILSLSLSFV